jgi:hypothetical protein
MFVSLLGHMGECCIKVMIAEQYIIKIICIPECDAQYKFIEKKVNRQNQEFIWKKNI